MKRLMLLLGMLSWASFPLIACPSCNIFNYLGSSIKSSTEIWMVKIVELKADYIAKLEVTGVIRGSAEAGHQFEANYYSLNAAVGDALIWSNPTSLPPNFPIVPAAWEREVRRLAFNLPIIDTRTAVEFIQGISQEVRDAAEGYVMANFDACRPHLIAALNQGYASRRDPNWDEFVEHRLEQLVRALLLKGDPAVFPALEGLIDRIAAEGPDEALASDRPFRGEPEGAILRAMLIFSPESGETRKRFKQRLKDKLPEVVGANVRWFAFALGDSPDSVEWFKSLPQEQQRAAAYGFYDLSRWHSSWWAHEASQWCRDAALTLYSGDDLTTLVKKDEDQLSRLRRGSKR